MFRPFGLVSNVVDTHLLLHIKILVQALLAHLQALHHGFETFGATINPASIHSHRHADGFLHEFLELTVDPLETLGVCDMVSNESCYYFVFT